MGEVTEKIYCCDWDDNNNALAAAIIAGNNRRDDTFPNGKTGYLGALGEWKAVYNNETEIDSAIRLIGGTSISFVGDYWTSTQSSSNGSWILDFPGGYIRNYPRNDNTVDTRAFCQLSNNQNT